MQEITAYLTKQMMKELTHYLEVVAEMAVDQDLPANIYEIQSRCELYEQLDLLTTIVSGC